MDKGESYRQVVRRLIEEYSQYRPSHGRIDTELIMDRERDHYEWDLQLAGTANVESTAQSCISISSTESLGTVRRYVAIGRRGSRRGWHSA